MSAPLAHVAGIPLEETLLTAVPAGGVLVALVGMRLKGLVAWLRRR